MSESKVLVQDTITAATTQTLAGARASTAGASLSAEADVHIISTCATRLNAVGLPVADKKLSGRVKTIRNEGTATCLIWPDTGGVITTSVGSPAADIPYVLDKNKYVKLQTSDGKNWRVIDESQGRVEYLSDGNYTVYPSESGKTFLIGPVTEARTITLPAPASFGPMWFKFKLTSNAAFSININSPTNSTMFGTLIMVADAAQSANAVAAGQKGVRFINTALIGDWIEIQSNGTNYYASALGSVDDCIEDVAN